MNVGIVVEFKRVGIIILIPNFGAPFSERVMYGIDGKLEGVFCRTDLLKITNSCIVC